MTSPSTTRTTLASLRSVLPHRAVSFDEAKRIAELQACKLRELINDPDGIREHHIAGLPRIAVVFRGHRRLGHELLEWLSVSHRHLED